MTEKVLGYTYIVFGTILMILSLFSVYQIFINKVKPITLFNLPGISIDLSGVAPEVPQEVKEKESSPQSLKTELVQKEVINAPLNLLAHIIIMGFIANIGFKIASLGTLLVRPIKVTFRDEKEKITADKNNLTSQTLD